MVVKSRENSWGRASGAVGDGLLERLHLVSDVATAGVVHLLRDIEAMIERGGRSREIGAALQAQARQMFHWWHRVRDGTLAHRTFASYMWPVRQEVERLLDAGQTCGVPKTEGTCRELFKLRRALWDIRAARRGGAHEQRRRTRDSARGPLAQGELWHP